MQKTALFTAGIIFLIISLLHAIRLFFKITIIAGGVVVPLWVSGFGFLIMLAFAYWMFKMAKGDQ